MDARTLIRSLVSWLPDLAYYAGMFRKASGTNDAAPAPAAPQATVKSRSGFIGSGDEKRMLVNLHKVDKKIPGSAKVLSKFIGWLFDYSDLGLAGTSYMRVLHSMFRTHITDMGTSEGVKIGSEEVTFTIPASTPTPTTQGQQKSKPSQPKDLYRRTEVRDILADGTNNSVELLGQMYHIIIGEDTEEEGFEVCKAYLKNQGVPVGNKEHAKKCDKVLAVLGANLSAVLPRLEGLIKSGKDITEKSLADLNKDLAKEGAHLKRERRLKVGVHKKTWYESIANKFKLF